MLALLAQGFTLGLSAGMSPGPFQAFLANRAGDRGLTATLPLAAAPLVSDIPIVAAVLTALSFVSPTFLTALRIAGGAFMIYLGARSLLTARRQRRSAEAQDPADAPPQESRGAGDRAAGRVAGARTTSSDRGEVAGAKGRRGFGRAVLMNALSPGPYVFWSVLAGPIVVDAWKTVPMSAVAFVAAFYLALIGSFLVVVVLFGLLARGGERVQRIVVALTGAALVGFGIYQAVQGVSTLL
jgi:threonine/homoserine/homoserine lactone efflux protein